MSSYDAERTAHVGEKDYVGFFFSGDDLPTGTTVTSATVAVSPATGLTLASASATLTSDADGCYVWFTAVTAGIYSVTFTVTFSDTKKLIRIYQVRVE